MSHRESLHALLQWYVAAGVDETIDTAPHDRFTKPVEAEPVETEAPAGSQAAAQAQPPARPDPAPAAAPGGASWSAHDTAQACATLAELVEAVRHFEGCALKRTATNTVIGDGDPKAPTMLIGEAPGAEEDRQGLPFVGPAGHLLDKMLAAIELDRSKVYITNILPWRPPGNRSPTAEEITICQPFVERQIELIQPKVLILVGGISAKALLNRREGITRLRGRWYDFATPRLDAPIPTTAIFHPAYLLRQSAAKKETWRDLLDIEEKIRNLS